MAHSFPRSVKGRGGGAPRQSGGNPFAATRRCRKDPAMKPSPALVGLGLMLASTTAFAGMGACFRLAIQDGLPLPLVPFARGAFTLLILSPWLLRQGVAGVGARGPPGHAPRCAARLAPLLLYIPAVAPGALAGAGGLMPAHPPPGP